MGESKTVQPFERGLVNCAADAFTAVEAVSKARVKFTFGGS